jgi:hypothetical protein
MLRLAVSWPSCLGVSHSYRALDTFYYCQKVADLLMMGALSDERTGLQLQLLLGLTSAVILLSACHRTLDNIPLSPK